MLLGLPPAALSGVGGERNAAGRTLVTVFQNDTGIVWTVGAVATVPLHTVVPQVIVWFRIM